MADDLIDERIKREARPAKERVRSRAKSLKREQRGIGDANRAAERLLTESESRKETDPAPRDLREDRVERRSSDDATPPSEDQDPRP